MRDCTLRAEWQCRPHCHSTSNARLHAPTLPLDVERTEDVALTPDDLAYAEAVALPRVVLGHPCLVEEVSGRVVSVEPLPRVRLRCHTAGTSATNTTRDLPTRVLSADTRGVLRPGSPPAPPRRLSTASLSWQVASASRGPWPHRKMCLCHADAAWRGIARRGEVRSDPHLFRIDWHVAMGPSELGAARGARDARGGRRDPDMTERSTD